MLRLMFCSCSAVVRCALVPHHEATRRRRGRQAAVAAAVRAACIVVVVACTACFAAVLSCTSCALPQRSAHLLGKRTAIPIIACEPAPSISKIIKKPLLSPGRC